MTRRQSPTPEGAEPPDPTPDELESYDEVQRLITETGPGAAVKVIVFKRRADGKPPDRCREFTAGELSCLDVIPEKLGGGEYILQLMDQANRYVKRLQVSWPVEMYPPPRPAAPAPTQSPTTSAGTPAPAGVDSFAQVVLLMQQESQRAQERYTALLQSIVTTMIGASRPASVKDRLEEMAALKALMPATATPIDLVKDAVMTGMNLARGKTGDAEADDAERAEDWMGVINKGLELMGKAIDNRAATGPRAVAPATGPRAAGAAPAGAPVPEHLRPYLWLMKYVPAAIGWAKSGTPVDRAAQAIYALVPEQHLDVLESFARMTPADRGQLLVQLDPRLGPYQAYMDELALQLVQVFDNDTEDDNDAGDVPGAAESA